MTSANPVVSRIIARVSRVMVWVTILLAALLVAADIIMWTDRSLLEQNLRREMLPDGAMLELTPGVFAALLVLAHLAFAIILWGLWNTFQLFRGYRSGAVFTVEAGQRLRSAGLALAVQPFVQLLLSGLGSALLTMNNPSGQRQLAIAIEDADLTIGVAGGLVFVVGWVMAEAARIAEDHNQII